MKNKLSKRAKKILFSLLIASTLLVQACTKNVLDSIADKNSDRALFEDARKAVDSADYATAISKITEMSEGGRDDIDVKRLLASAYAGNCGFEFIPFFQDIQDADLTNANFFAVSMAAFVGKAVNPTDCALSLNTFADAYPVLADRPSDISLMMTLLGLAKMGTFIRYKADIDGSDTTGDGTVDASFNACTDFTNDDVAEITSGLGTFLINFVSSAASFGGSATDISAFQTACDTLTSGACSKTEASDVSNSDITAMRTILRSNALGIGGCNEPNAAAIPLCCI